MNSLVFMGVAGCGKSSLGSAVASALGLPLIEGDDFHSDKSKQLMRSGIPLTDELRAGWLETLGSELEARPDGAVLTCSSLKRAYREVLRRHAPGLRFVFLDITRDEAMRRVASRAGAHLFPTTLVDSQFATLESPVGEAGVLRVDATAPLPDLVAQVSAWFLKDRP
ncbi:MAG: gluconokinase [Rhizobacter sp.]